MTGTAVSIAGVGVQYGTGSAGVRALDGISLEVRRGELLMVFGPSGSGKTTLLQIIGVLIRPTAGTVQIDGQTVDHLSMGALRQLRLDFFGFVFQAHHLIPTLRAWENVALALDLKRVRRNVAER